MGKLERDFQAGLIRELKELLPGCMIMKLDADYIQGIPDLLVLWNDRWATLECKRRSDAKHQENQDWYVDKMNQMSFSAFIYPENKEDILNELLRSFRADRQTCPHEPK